MFQLERDQCIFCGKELSPWEPTRSSCWDCNEMFFDTYHEEERS